MTYFVTIDFTSIRDAPVALARDMASLNTNCVLSEKSIATNTFLIIGRTNVMVTMKNY